MRLQVNLQVGLQARLQPRLQAITKVRQTLRILQGMVLKTYSDSKSLIIIGPSPQVLRQQPTSQTGFIIPTTNIREALTKGS